jgi:hypothetical protein
MGEASVRLDYHRDRVDRVTPVELGDEGITVTRRRAMARPAGNEGYRRVDRTTDSGNSGAQPLDDRLGVPRQEKVFHRLASAELQRLPDDDE